MKVAASLVVAVAVWLAGFEVPEARAERVDWSQYIETNPSRTYTRTAKQAPKTEAKAKAKAKAKKSAKKKKHARGKRGSRRR